MCSRKTVDDLLAQLTPAWLTRVLGEHGHLPRGRVADVEIARTSETLPSRHVQLVATYSPEASPTAPEHLFLKLAKPATLAAAARETLFYTTIAPRMPAIPLVPCYGAGTAEAGTPYLLLADVSATHGAWEDGPPPGRTWGHGRRAGAAARVVVGASRPGRDGRRTSGRGHGGHVCGG